MSARDCTCPQCGKAFWVMSPSDWAYRDKATYYCSWKCIREHDHKIPPHPETDAPKPGPMSPEELEKFEAEDKRIRTKLRRQCTVKPSEEKREGQRRKRHSPEEIKTKLTEMRRIVDADGLSWADAAAKLNVPPSTLWKWLAQWREELGIPRISHAEAGRKTQEKRRKAEGETNFSGEKKARILAALARIHAALTELSEEVANYGG